MRSISVVAVLLLSSMGVWGQKLPLDVKTGLWETTSTSNVAGELPMPPDELAKLTPEQRAKIEQAVKGMSGKPIVTKSCLTKEKLDRGYAFNDRKECNNKVVKSSAHNLEVQVSCKEPDGAKVNGVVKAEALTSTNAKGTVHMTIENSGRTMNSDSTFTSKWLSSNCGSVK